ncbi:MAG TPA: 3-oxoacyl-[acyl-carrier-protein] reductase [Herpetosiphonaceae bacterium]|nr:3-oxoacyl-[acyl-carrier-protein] reductase [Herpetosiphonaceae bacterium]
MHIDLAGRVALVTGASRGIGRAIALALGASGAAVVVNYRGSEAAAQEAVAAITGQGGQAIAVQADVSDPASHEALIKAATEAFGRLDILVNNAGITRDNLLLRMKAEEIDDVLNTNLRGVMLLTKAALRPMMKNKWGRIVSMSSIIGLTGNAGQANYAATKAGLLGFTKSLALEMASRNITANAICPGFIDTDMTAAALSDDLRAKALERVPLGRLGTPADIANAVVFLASDAASYITGQTLAVDGGWTMY